MKPLKPLIPNELIEKILGDQCVAYIGAGLSAGAGLPLWNKTLEKMVEWCAERKIELPKRSEIRKFFRDNKFLLLAETLANRMGRGEYHDFLVSVFRRPGLVPTENHFLLPKIPFVSILTSNYDKLIESAYAAQSGGASPPHVFTHLDRPEIARAMRSGEFHVFKAHGDIDRLESLVLTFKDYRTLMQGNEPYKLYLQNIFTSKTVLFLGFSLNDPDLTSLLDGLRFHLGDDMAHHYALMDKTKISAVEIKHLREDYGIEVIAYRPAAPSHPEVGEFLRELARRIPPKAARLRRKAQEETDKIDSHYTLIPTGKDELGIFEKYPGAAAEKPLTTGFTLKVDRSPEGKAARNALKELNETGETVTFTSEQVLDWNLPDLFFKATGIVLSEVQITVGSYRNGEKMPVTLIVTNDLGAERTLEYIKLECVANGEKRTRFSNEEQKSAWKIELVEEIEAERSYVNIEFNPLHLMNVYQAERNWQFAAALAAGGRLIIRNAATGLDLREVAIEAGKFPAPQPGFLKLLKDLTFIERKTNTTLKFQTQFHSTELNVIEATERVLRTGKIDGAFAINLTLEADSFREIIQRAEMEKEIPLEHYQSDHSTIIFGERVFLGAIWLEARKLSFAPEERARWQEKLKNIADEFITIRFNFPAEAEATLYFLEYITPEDWNIFKDNTDLRDQVINSIIRGLLDAAKLENERVDEELFKTYFDAASGEPAHAVRPLATLQEFTDEELSAAAKSVIEAVAPAQAQTLVSIIEAR